MINQKIKKYHFLILFVFLFSCSGDKNKSGKGSSKTQQETLYFTNDGHPFKDFTLSIQNVKLINKKGKSFDIILYDEQISLPNEQALLEIGTFEIPTGTYTQLQFDIDLSETWLQLTRSSDENSIDLVSIDLADSEGKSVPSEKAVFSITIDKEMVIEEESYQSLKIHFDTHTSIPFLDVDGDNPILTFTPVFTVDWVEEDEVQIEDEDASENITESSNDNESNTSTGSKNSVITSIEEDQIRLKKDDDDESIHQISELQLITEDGDILSEKELHIGQLVTLSGRQLVIKRSKYIARVFATEAENKKISVLAVQINNLKPANVFTTKDADKKEAITTIKFKTDIEGIEGPPNALSAAEIETTFFTGKVKDILAVFYGYLDMTANQFSAYFSKVVNLLDIDAHIDLSKPVDVTILYKKNGDDFNLTFEDSGDIPVKFTIPDDFILLELGVSTIVINDVTKAVIIEPSDESEKSTEYTTSLEFLTALDEKINKNLYFNRISISGSVEGNELKATDIKILLRRHGTGTSPTHVIRDISDSASDDGGSSLSLGQKIGLGVGAAAAVLLLAVGLKKMISALISKFKKKDGSKGLKSLSNKEIDGNDTLQKLKKHNPAAYESLVDSMNSDKLNGVDEKQRKLIVDATGEYIQKNYPGVLEGNDPEKTKALLQDLSSDDAELKLKAIAQDIVDTETDPAKKIQIDDDTFKKFKGSVATNSKTQVGILDTQIADIENNKKVVGNTDFGTVDFEKDEISGKLKRVNPELTFDSSEINRRIQTSRATDTQVNKLPTDAPTTIRKTPPPVSIQPIRSKGRK